MKVIIIKDCKDGKVNDIVDVSDGYAKNFLIRKGFALPINHATKHAHDKRLKKINEDNKKAQEYALKVKKSLEDLTLSFKLKTTNNVVHGSITKKQIVQKLKTKKIKIDSHAIGHVQISSIGITTIDVKVSKNTVAKLKVEVRDAE